MSIEQAADRLLDRMTKPGPEPVLRGLASEESADDAVRREPLPESGLTELEMARAVVGNVLARSKDDPNAYLSSEAVAAFTAIRDAAPLEYERLRTDLKQANRLIRVCARWLHPGRW